MSKAHLTVIAGHARNLIMQGIPTFAGMTAVCFFC
jgi:hypothetical protein